MAETRRYSFGGQLDIEQILLEAQHRWLRPAEICEILQNYQKFKIAPEPAHMPPSGSLFLFDRKVLRYFRKDGHNWRKKKDGKTVKEAHERLKAGSVDVLHCYYAHGEENENFQRRSYWLLEEERSNIVLVHYLEVKNRTNVHRIREAEEVIPRSFGVDAVASGDIESSFSSNFHQNSYQVGSQTTDTTSSNSAQASEYEDAESAYNNQTSTTHPFTGLQQAGIENVNSGPTDPYYPLPYSNGYQGELPVIPGMDSISAVNISKDDNIVGSAFENQRHPDIPCWEEVLKSCISGSQSLHLQPPSMTEPNELLAQLLTNNAVKMPEPGSGPQVQDDWQAYLSKQTVQNSVTDNGQYLKPDLDGNVEGKTHYSSLKPLNNALVADGLKKIDSFNRWMSRELEDVNDLYTNSASRSYWDPVDGENGVVDSSISSHEHENTFMPSPSLAQDQLFSIVDFSPNWAYSGSEIKVLITGRFLKSKEEAECCKWSCMFGEVEVPAEIVADGVLRCHAPVHKAGRVPFYVTCSNRFACSEVREFEFRVNNSRDVNSTNENKVNTIEILKTRFTNLLSKSSSWSANSELSNQLEQSQLSIKISSLLKEDNDEWDNMFSLVPGEEFSAEITKERLLQKLLKEKLHTWLIIKAAEGGKGASVLDEGGQGVLHFAAALGYDWALQPTIIAGVSVNFRDVHGWTALHWAAFYGRERTVATLIALDAAPGALTDPTPKYPSGRTPADLASASKHKGIAGYLAECALSNLLESINLDGGNGDVGSNVDKVVQSISERHPVSAGDGDLPSGLSLKDSLAAVCNATQAAARIHQIFRIQSFQRKQLKDLGDDEFENSDHRALSLLAAKAHKPAQINEPVHAAAIRIQNKFRGWKCRKEFLTTRQHIVRIQAHFRGHQVRKNHSKIVWSVGIVEKIILRWRRKGSGLRGFKREALNESSSMMDTSSKDDDDDFLKEGRKQTEVRLKKALDRVKSMVQYPEARDQYRRLLNVVNEIQETKAKRENALDCSEDAQVFNDDLIDIEDLFDEEMLMSMT